MPGVIDLLVYRGFGIEGDDTVTHGRIQVCMGLFNGDIMALNLTH